MKIYTPLGTKDDATRKDLDESLDGLQRVLDADCFVGVERDDGTFLQMRQLPIEYRGPDWDMPRRGSVPPAVRAMFHEFVEGGRDWDRGVEWIEVPKPRWWQSLPWWAVVTPFAVLAALLFFFLIPNCAG